jgi:PAS domain S-box-containing protein
MNAVSEPPYRIGVISHAETEFPDRVSDDDGTFAVDRLAESPRPTMFEDDIDCLLVSQRAVEGDVPAYVESVRNGNPTLPIVLLVTGDAPDVIPAAFGVGVSETLPWSLFEQNPSAVFDRIETVLERRELPALDRPSEERDHYATVVQQSYDAVVVVQDREYVFVNDRFCELTGRDRRELIGTRFSEVFTPECRELVEDRYERRVAGEDPPRRYDVEIAAADGETRVLNLAVSRILHDGRPATMANFRDVTEQRQLERTYREIFEGVSDGLVIHDPEDGEIVNVNDQFCELTGYAREELLGETVDLVTPPEYSYEEAQSKIERAKAKGSHLFEWWNHPKDGDPHPIEVHLSLVTIRGAERVLASVRDITERERRKQEYEEIFNGVSDVINVYDAETTDLLAVNQTCVELTGYDRETILENGIGLVSATEEGFTADRAADVIDAVHEAAEPKHVEWQIETAAGERRTLDVLATPATIAGEDRVITISRDVTEPRRIERRLDAILDRIDEAIFIAAATELDSADPAPDYLSSGYDEIWGQPLEALQEEYENGFFDTLHPADAAGYQRLIDRILEDIDRGTPDDRYTREYRIERPDGSIRWVHSDFYPLEWGEQPLRVVIFSRDVTDRKRRERRMASFEEATDELAAADSPTEATRTAIEAATETLELSIVGAFLYDAIDGALEPAALSTAFPNDDSLEPIEVRSGPLWQAFAAGGISTPAKADPDSDLAVFDSRECPLTDWRAMALGNHGVLLLGSDTATLDADTVQSAQVLAATLEAALNHLESQERLAEQQAALESQTERADRLERLTEITQRVEAAITDASTRVGVEEAVCDELAAIDPYGAVWIGEAEVGADRLSPRVVSGSASVVAVPTSGEESERDPHPATVAWRENDLCVVEEVVGDGVVGSWRRGLLESGHQALCAVPMSHRGRMHGVLVITSTRPNVFGERERAAFDQLGRSIANALSAVERRRGLESDDTVEVEFQAHHSSVRFARISRELDTPVRHARTVRRDDGSVSVFYELLGESPDLERLQQAVESVYPEPTDVSVVTSQASRSVIELQRRSWFGSPLPDYGGILRRASATPTKTTIVVELPVSADRRSFVDQITEAYPELDLTAQRQHQQSDRTPQETAALLEERLTDRQLEILETAVASGYFEWPRDHSAEDLAEQLGITQPTVGKHLRNAERKTFELLLGDRRQ